MNNLGIMQGRLTDKGGFYPQQFPWTNWQQAEQGIFFDLTKINRIYGDDRSEDTGSSFV